MKKQPLLVLALFACFMAGTFAQTTFPLFQKTEGATSNTSLSEREKKLEKARAIYEKLVAARGDSRYPVPQLTLGTTEANGAMMYYGVPEIMLEEKAYDVCASFKEDADVALASMLGHELTHYYEKHGWRRGFVAEYRDLKIKMKLDSLQEKVGFETQADYIGGFLAYTAGYGIFDKGPLFVQAIYDAYDLQDSLMPGYPLREDRKEMSRRTAKRVEHLVEVFEMANLLTIVDLYPEAKQFYNYVLREYQSREIYNNMGVLGILEARKFFSESEFKYHLPIELDLESSSSGRDPDPKVKKLRDSLLVEALRHFDSAISLDPNYAPAYLNKACAYALLGDASRAQFYAEIEAIQCATKHGPSETASDARVLLGILAAMRGDNTEARKILEKEVANKNSLAKTNLRILLGTPETTETAPERPERIDGVELDTYKDSKFFDIDIPIEGNTHFYKDTVLNKEPGQNSKILWTGDATTGKPFAFFHITKPNYKGESGGKISIGAKQEAIENAYKTPHRIIKSPRGTILKYGKIIFILGSDGKLERWVNYSK